MSNGFNIRAPAPPVAPPDYTRYSNAFGTGVIARECYLAADELPDVSIPFGYFTAEPRFHLRSALELPFSINYGKGAREALCKFGSTIIYISIGGCYISATPIGPTVLDPWPVVPRNLRIMAAQTIQTFVIRGGGTGGYTTFNLAGLLNHLPDGLFRPLQMPPSSAFLALSVTGPELKLSPPEPHKHRYFGGVGKYLWDKFGR